MNLRSTAFAACALLAAACAPVTRQTGEPLRQSATTLMVQNDNWTDVAMYLVRGSQRIRLGSVGSMMKGEFVIPSAYVMGVSDVTVQAHPLGTRDTYQSPPIQVFPGARVELRLANQLRLSSFAVYATN